MIKSANVIGRPSETKVRAKRLETGAALMAETRTIGAPLAFKLSLDNISRTGFLLDSGTIRIPYQINTLLEMTVDPSASKLDRPIHLLGRIVRTTQLENSSKKFGVHIIQIDSNDFDSWEKYVEHLESGVRALPAAS